MRVDSATLPQAAREHSRVFNTSKTFPTVPSSKANENATSAVSSTENIAAQANTAENTTKPAKEKLTPAGLLAAQLRFQSMNSEDMTKGQTRALEVITRNLARYQVATPSTPKTTTDTTTSTTPASDASTTTSGSSTATDSSATVDPTAT